MACDLCDTSQLSAKLDACGVDRNVPTAFIAECVLVYMSAEQSSSLVKWIADNFLSVFFVNYEQVSDFLIQSINQSIIILSEQMQKHCSHCTSIWGDITCQEMTVKKR